MRNQIQLSSALAIAAMAVLLVASHHPQDGKRASVLPLAWAETVGQGVAVPACGSSTVNGGNLSTCNDGKPSVSFNWASDGPTPDGTPCDSAAIRVNGGTIASGLPCSGSYTWGGGARNTSYTYEVVMSQPAAAAGHQISSGGFSTPNCVSAYCSADPQATSPGKTVTWRAVASGGTGSYAYSWSGTDGLSGSTAAVQKSYSTKGTKTASVTITSGGASTAYSCSQITVADPPCIGTCSANGGGGGGGGGGTGGGGFGANPSVVSPGQSSTLTWSTQNATSCSIDNGVGPVSTNGSVIVTPAETTTYTLTCSGLGGTVSAQVKVTVASVPKFKEVIPE